MELYRHNIIHVLIVVQGQLVSFPLRLVAQLGFRKCLGHTALPGLGTQVASL
jgi:hypothetical protein